MTEISAVRQLVAITAGMADILIQLVLLIRKSNRTGELTLYIPNRTLNQAQALIGRYQRWVARNKPA